MERVLENLAYVERLIGNLERGDTKEHLKSAAKECLLASKSVIDCLIDTLEEEQGSTNARKINIL